MPDNEMGTGRQGAPLVALVADLMFASRIRGAAPSAKTVQSLPHLVSALGPATRLVLVDVQARDALAGVAEAKARAPGAEVVAFGPHVDEAALDAVRRAGADRVLSRGRFVRDLPGLVAGAR